jgi:hypothetical protein
MMTKRPSIGGGLGRAAAAAMNLRTNHQTTPMQFDALTKSNSLYPEGVTVPFRENN